MNTNAVGIRSVMAVAGAVLLAVSVSTAGQEKKRPSVSVRANPSAGFSPLKVSLTAEVNGGPDDFADFYCPTVEWVWGDDTRAESTSDCDPYEPGKSEIKRRYFVSRIFNTAGNYKVEFRLKQKNKVVGSGSIQLQIRPGVRDGGGD
jgi:hypothetical protein